MSAFIFLKDAKEICRVLILKTRVETGPIVIGTFEEVLSRFLLLQFVKACESVLQIVP